jgi:type II secretory ATPase GspE/PulE/Tfp pilus assembly ATPase PilB-like protein
MANVSASMFNTREYQDAQISDRSRIPAGLDGIRIATAPTAAGYEMSLRLLYNDAAENHSLESLGFTQPQDNAMRFLRRLPHGINLIGGPTGSGKSTTLQRNLRLLDGECDHTKRILTVEDPPEYTIAGAIQTPVTNAETEEERGVKFRAAIRSALRRDPDVLMIGEIRDYASADLAFQASMTGHQVWSTLHVNGVFSALDRLENLGIAPAILYDPSIVTGLVSQRLLKRLCDHCKEPFARVKERYSGAEQERILRATKVRDLYVRGTGCPHCNQEGTTGRIAVAEIVVTDHKLMSYLRAGDKMGAIDYWRREQGGLTTLENAIFRINAGEVDPLDAESQLGPLTMTEILKDHRIEQTEVDRAGSS